ncbi:MULTISPECIES: hypothetical protein [unclassified Streptomyces]|uniref:hypothetical protein n=1 Tax=unclassified Streptomyces TaxID=2593676 RepID=UPI0033DC59EE
MTIDFKDAAQADALAAKAQYRVSSFFARVPQAEEAACPWHLVSLAPAGTQERATVAWIVADAVMRQRCGRSPAYDKWRSAALAGMRLSGDEAQQVAVCVQSVFGIPTNPSNAADHVPGYVGEWLWFLLTREDDLQDREVALLEPPSWNVTEGGADGFVVHRLTGGTDMSLLFRLWELKKFTGTGSVNATITKAAKQLNDRGLEYLAKLCSVHADKPGDLGELMSQLTQLWSQADPRGGVGVSVSTNAASVPKKEAFTQLSAHLPQLRHPGQLQGVIVAVEDFAAFADLVKEYLWSAL